MARAQVGEWSPYDGAGRRKYTSSGERRRFLEIADQFEPGLRAFCYVLALTGCRVSEALALTPDNIDTEGGRIIFRSLKKRGKIVYRAVPVPRSLIRMLLASPTDRGKLWTMHRVTAWRWITYAFELAQVEGPMSCPRGLRHGFGIRAAGEKIPPSLIQKWMGHSRLETTMTYLDAVGPEERSHAKRMWS